MTNDPFGVHPTGAQILNEGFPPSPDGDASLLLAETLRERDASRTRTRTGLSHQSPLSGNTYSAPQFLTYGNPPQNCEQDRKGLIRIRTEMLDAVQVVIHIADNGPGMSETVKQRIFDPFFTTKSVGKGTGLGLSISYQIVTEKHGGQLECVSAPGQGAEFIITIPVKQAIAD